MATVYHRDQPGAPALVYSGAEASAAHFNAFKEILKSCLVSGYGSQPAAGWSLIAEAVNFLALRNASGSYVHLYLSAQSLVTIYLSATYDVALSGDGLKTGVAANNAIPHRYPLASLAGASGGSTWSLVADGRAFIFLPSPGLADVAWGPTAGYSYQPGPLYIGDDSNGNFIACGGMNTENNSYNSVFGYFGALGFTSLYYPHTGLLVGAGSLALDTNVLAASSKYAETTTGSSLALAVLTPLSWESSGVWGDFLGLCADLRLLAKNPYAAALALGVSGGLTSRTANTLIPLGGGFSYLAAIRFGGNAPFFMATNNAEFWP